ncbi:N-acetyltransferase [Reticulibacter mediterranei]|uniref:N-acetyltransferase n=1 Tax=Reticulibacter mediterranei TaxID=2778369 RepID=A0A8J3IZR1_9CHLR|nr:GNAT family N-acetyltransferase [Reticulibacter mediterranei]GHO98226.1 N-acetyltransferase [Reticulibacter mediterranei]
MQVEMKLASLDEMYLVHAVMRKAFEEYRDVLIPPSGALRESIEDIVKKTSSGGRAMLAEIENVAVGSAQFTLHEDHIWVGRISVLPSHRSQGIGRQMMKYIEEYARQQGLNEARLGVRQSLPGNVSFYQKLQYEIVAKKAHPSGVGFWYEMRKVL